MAGILIIAHAPLASALRDCAAHVYCGQPQLGSSRLDLVGARGRGDQPRRAQVQFLPGPASTVLLPPTPKDFEARNALPLGMRFLSRAILVKPAAKWLSKCGRTQGPRPLIP